MNRKKIIGIVPSINFYNQENPYLDCYKFIDLYAKKIFNSNAIPIGLLLKEGQVIEEQLELCDAYLWPGGNKINKNLYKILYYALIKKKPVFGICLGMQAMCLFSSILEELQNKNININELSYDDFIKIYKEMIEENPPLKKFTNENIHHNEITKNKYNHALHKILINEDNLLYDIYGKEKKVLHLHSMYVIRTGKLLEAIAYSEDNVIEAVKGKNINWVGVQFHPEFLEEDKLIEGWIKTLK